jgi:hypothetical protein
MAVTQAQIDGLNQALADGVRQVTIGDQTTTYNTTDSLIHARDDLQRQFNAEQARAAGKPRGTRTRLYFAGRGYE